MCGLDGVSLFFFLSVVLFLSYMTVFGDGGCNEAWSWKVRGSRLGFKSRLIILCMDIGSGMVDKLFRGLFLWDYLFKLTFDVDIGFVHR